MKLNAWLEAMMDLTTQGLERFVEAQDPVYASVCEELAAEQKTSNRPTNTILARD
ncbi:MAG: hypothetical protein WA147_09825 [Polaromonas sp.]